jgi:hypothetical protein
VTGQDWRGDEISQSTDSDVQIMQKYFDFVLGAYEPIPIEQGSKKGSAISTPERFMGMRPAPMYLTAPEQYDAMKRYQARKRDQLKRRHDAAHQRVYGGTQ